MVARFISTSLAQSGEVGETGDIDRSSIQAAETLVRRPLALYLC
jgi:hypothetical protein